MEIKPIIGTKLNRKNNHPIITFPHEIFLYLKTKNETSTKTIAWNMVK